MKIFITKHKDLFIALVTILISGIVVYFLFAPHSGAWFQDDNQTTGCNSNNPDNCPKPSEICGNGEHTGNPHCITPTIIPSPEDTPEVTESPIPTNMLPTLTIHPCEGNVDFGSDVFAIDCITPLLTPTEEVTPIAGTSATPTPVPPTSTLVNTPMPTAIPTPEMTLTPCSPGICGYK